MTEVAIGGPSSDVTGDAVKILYRNYRGETAVRQIVPFSIWFGSTEWHPEPQWLLEALDLDKKAKRSFALKDILTFDCE
jgi:predicted DNA-binding transcriptional regulator YafY